MRRPVFLFILLLFTPLWLASCKESTENAAAPPAPEVTVSAPLKKNIIEWDEYTGRFQAVERVEVRARVSGYLEEIRFKDGDIVQEGDVLFVIDQRPFQIALDRAQAQYELAYKDFKRVEGLRNSKAVSQEDFDSRLQEFRVAKADLEDAKLDVEFTEIKAPVKGRVSRNLADVGNLVNGDVLNATLLTTIVSLDPIHFYFEASEQELLKYVRLDRSGARPGSDDNPNPIYVKLQDEKEFSRVGRMDFVDNEVDAGTGTIQGRALFSNENTVIYPGMFGRARLLGSGRYEAMLVPDEVIGTDQSRKFVMVVNGEGKAQRKFVEIGPLRDSGLRIIRSGLDSSDQIIINGLQRARPGTPVTVAQGSIEEPGEDRLPVFEQPLPEIPETASGEEALAQEETPAEAEEESAYTQEEITKEEGE